MSTPNELNEKLQRTRKDLADAATAMSAKRDIAEAQDSDPETATHAAASLIVLEARAKRYAREIEQGGAELKRLADFVKSEEYKDGQKKIAGLEAHFAQEADEIHGLVMALIARVEKNDERHAEYSGLVDRFCVDLDPHGKISKAANMDCRYIVGVHHALIRNNTALVYGGVISRDHKKLAYR